MVLNLFLKVCACFQFFQNYISKKKNNREKIANLKGGEGADKRTSVAPGERFEGAFQRWVSIDKAVYRSLYGSQSYGCI